MAGNDNILQAPAQGFGQEVTFTARPDARNTPNLDGLSRLGQTRGGVQGVPVAGHQQRMTSIEAPPPSPTFALLSKVAEAHLQQKVKEERAKAFVTGMQRAAGGEAIKDIAEGQPWYARIFGESDVVEGARTYTAHAKAAEAAAAIEDSMSEVRKLGPAESNAYFSQLVAKHMTGDAATDASLMQGFARTLPATMRRQAKEHYAWKQEEASKAESSALLSAAELLQKRATSDKQTDDEYATQAVQLIANMRPAVGRDIDSWTKARTNDLLALAQGGKFHAVNAIRQAGMLNLLPPEARTKVETALDTAENRTIATKSFEYADEIGRIAGQAEVFSTDLSPERTRQQLGELNARFRKETGIDRDLISLDKGSGIVKDAHVTILREGERRIRQAEEDARKAAAEGDKERAKLVKMQGALSAISLGHAGAAQRVGDGMSSIVDEQFLNVYRTLSQQPNGLQQQATLLWQNYTGNGTGDGYINKDIKDTFERRVEVSIGAQMPADFLKLHDEYAALKARHPALADAYFGKHADRMAVFDSLLQPGAVGSRNEAMAFVTAFGSQEPPRFKPLGDKERKAARSAIGSQHDSSDWKFWKQQREPLREDQLDAATNDLDNLVAKYRSLPGVSLEQATQRAFAEQKRLNGADMVGGYYIRGQRGQQPLSTILSAMRPGDSAVGTGPDAPDVWDSAVRGYIEQRAVRLGLDTSEPVSVLRNPDQMLTLPDGKTQYPVAWLTVIYRKDGVDVPVNISSDDIKNFAREADNTRRNPPDKSIGPALTNRIDKDRPSIYSSPEEWAAYRKRHQAKK